MKRYTPFEVGIGVFCMLVMLLATIAEMWKCAKAGAWSGFWTSLFCAMFLSAALGWIAIDAFNRHIRFKRLMMREERRP